LALIIPLTAADYDLSVASVLTLSGMIVAVLIASTAAESPECHFSAVAQIECDAEHNFFTLLRVG
jgi:hypothetical protein